MATPLDSMFMTGFGQGANVINNAQNNAYNFAGRAMQAQQLAMEQAFQPIRVRQAEITMDHVASMTAAQLADQELKVRQEKGLAEFAGAMANVTDWSDSAQVAKIHALGKLYPAAYAQILPRIESMSNGAERADYNSKLLDIRNQDVANRAEAVAARERALEEANQTKIEVAKINAESRIKAAEERFKPQSFANHATYAKFKKELDVLAKNSTSAGESQDIFNQKADQLHQRYLSEEKAALGEPVGIAQPQSQSEFDALPSGAEFINPRDGKRYRKK